MYNFPTHPFLGQVEDIWLYVEIYEILQLHNFST